MIRLGSIRNQRTHIYMELQDTCPEKKLMYAVLVDALIRHSPRDVRWIKSRDRVWPFSFENICTALNFDADYLRRKIKEMED